MNRFKFQKYSIFTFVILFNVVLSFLNIFYEKYWYIFIVILSLATFMNTLYSIGLFLNYIYNLFKKKSIKHNHNCLNNNLVISSHDNMATMATVFSNLYKYYKSFSQIIKLLKKPLPPLPHCHDEYFIF